MPTKAINRILQGLILAGLCHIAPVLASGPEQAASSAQVNAAVGQVSLAIGKAVLVHSNGKSEPAKAGLAVNVGDRVETQGNAVVHIHFIDNAMVSVRQLSRLEIQRYDYRSDDPAASAVKFNLIEGVTRAISGKAAQSARQNFRMNTPVAAIGVRGTDFVVRADQREARALVNEGTIIMAPFSTTCLVEALGPCSDNGLELIGGSQQMALVVADAGAPVLVTANGSGATENFLAGTVVRANASAGNNTGSAQSKDDNGNDPYTESVSSRVAKNVSEQRPPPTPPPVTPPVIEPPESPEFTPDGPLSEEVLTANQLVWGRWDESSASRDLLTLPKEVASSMGRAITVLSDSGRYALFRVEDGSKRVQPGLGVLAFDLKQAQAFYTSNGVTSPVDVLGGRLSIDFSQDPGRFSTSLDMRHDQLGNVNFSGQGKLDPGGYFNDRSATDQVMVGAVSLDGKEAGYAFEKALQNGLLEGLTLWGSKP